MIVYFHLSFNIYQLTVNESLEKHYFLFWHPQLMFHPHQYMKTTHHFGSLIAKNDCSILPPLSIKLCEAIRSALPIN